MAEFGIQSWAPGQAVDAGSESTISPTVDGAVAAADARVAELEADTRAQGTVLGDRMPLGGPVDYDETILMPLPGVPVNPPQQGGSYSGAAADDGSNMGGRS